MGDKVRCADMIVRATTTYAIQIMIAIAKSEGVISSSAISEQTGISQIYLKKVATCLKKAKLIHSRQGLCGGYSLIHPPEQITMLEILRSVEPEEATGTISKTEGQINESDSSILVQQMFSDINNKLKNYFEAVTLADLIEKPEGHDTE
ncbi:MAG: Rrf2 family transcriptional regulator [Methanocorpusculum sp.]|nr:Rrf2 family transcriptional regulator [Methanocorpusculum sp.]